jgi:Ca2+-binding RTX toxin-like protein
MYLRQQGTDLFGTSSLSRADVGGLLHKPQEDTSGLTFHALACGCAACAAAGASSEKDGNALHSPSTSSQSNLTTIAAPSNDIAVNGSIDAGETDFFGFNLVAGQTYMFSVYGSGATPLPDTFMYVLNGGFGLLNFDDDGGAGVNSLVTYTATYTGLHIIGVEGFSASQTGGYTLDAVQQPPIDVVGDTFAGAPSLTIGTVSYGFIDAGPDGPYGPGFGEVDTYSFTVEAGMFYTFEVAGGADYNSDPFNLPPGELDTVIAIYDGDGNLITFNDDINFAGGDIGSRVGFFATEDATLYLDVFSYQPWSGGFSITSSAINPADYDPLDSINWVNANNVQFDECNTAYVYFALPGENFGEGLPSFGWNDTEKQAVMLALEQYEHILGVNYEITTDVNEATFRLFTTTSTQFGAYMYPQDPAFGTQQGIAAFNVNSGGWDKDGFSTQNIPGDQVSLLQGGYSFETILHEFGHGHGLAHPHDTGGGSEIMLGVTAAQGSYGIYDLNQGVYTVMSYNSSWETGPNGESPFTIAGISNGWAGTLSAFDIAMLQERYGANECYATGNDTYVIDDVQAIGTYYECIWDTKGKDTIRYDGARNARIDLTAATLNYSPTGGGVVSFVAGIFGGFTIAAGVIIENATGGSGDDVLIGNDSKNELKGNAGDDFLMGRAGGDKLDGGVGFDTASYQDSGAGVKVSLASGSGSGGDAAGDCLSNIEAVEGSAFNDTLTGNSGNNTLTGGDGDDKLDGGNGNDTLAGGDGNDTLNGGNGVDVLSGGDGDDKLDGGNDNDSLSGGDGNDKLSGGNGIDTLDGGAGNDTLTGGYAGDHFVFAPGDGADRVTDFKKGQDLVNLAATDLVWSDLDTNANNRLDDADAFVSVSSGDTFIDLGAAAGGAAGIDTLKLDDVTNLTQTNFLFV